MLNRRAESRITNCDILTRKGPITFKVYREDGTYEVIANFKVSDLLVGEWREVMKACQDRKGKGWQTIYDQIQTRMDYLHTTEVELGINLDIPLTTKRLKSSVQYGDHLPGTVLNEPVLGLGVDDHARTFSSLLLAEIEGPTLQLNDSTGITLRASHIHLIFVTPLPLIPDHRGRQVIPRDYFINNDLEYLKGGSLSRQYSTSVTKTKAATYEIKWIEDMAPNLWSPVKVWYDYGYLDEIKVRKEVQQLYTFKEGDFPRLLLQDIDDIRIVIQRHVEDLQLGVKSYQKKLNLTKLDTFSDSTLNDVRTALYDIASGVRIQYLPKRKWSRFDKQRARVMIQDIDKHLFQKSLMRNLEKFIGGREYEEDLSLLTRII
ncbi:hypothetical protein Tco_0798018 [Tanacetum coccineum]